MMNNYFEEEYTRQMLDRIGCLPLICFVCVALFLSGCKTIRQTENIATHDTLLIYKVDTLKVYEQNVSHDTVKMVTEKYITVNEGGDTIRERIINNYFEKVVQKDSTNYYRAMLDSIKQAAITNMLTEKTIEKKPSFWDTWKWRIIALALFIASLLLLIPYTKKLVSNIRNNLK